MVKKINGFVSRNLSTKMSLPIHVYLKPLKMGGSCLEISNLLIKESNMMVLSMET